MDMENDPLTKRIIGAAIEVHRHLGPGLLESAYEECLCHELAASEMAFKQQIALPIRYKDIVVEPGFRADVIVEERVLLELKAVERMLPVHEAQVLTYLRLRGLPTGLLIDFNGMS